MTYFESRLPVNFERINDLQNRLRLCEKIGIKNIILEPQNDLRNISLDLKKEIESFVKINIFYRINLKIDTLDDFKSKIKNYNKFAGILSVESLNKEVQLRSAKDSRVDIISFSDPEILKSLTPGIVSLTKQNNSFIEFSLAPIMESNKVLQSKNFRNLYKYIHLVLKLKANFLISGNFQNLFNYRHPRALISVCHTLLGIPLVLAKKAFSINPELLIEKVQKSQNNIFNFKIN